MTAGQKRTIRIAIILLVCAFAVFTYLSGTEPQGGAGTVLRRGNGPEPESLDPHKSRSVQAADVLRDIGEGLVGYSPGGELIAAAAERWEVSEDGRQYDFWLRPVARWSNGDTVLAEHFVFSFRRLVNPETAAFYAQALADIENAADIIAGNKAIDSLAVEAVEKFHLRIRLRNATPYFLALLTHPSAFPVHPASVGQYGDAFARAGKLISNGAYKLDSWELGSVIRLSRNVHYWNNAGTAINKVNHYVTPESQVELNRYRAGELDLTANVPPEAFAALRQGRPEELRVAAFLAVYYYGLNVTRGDRPRGIDGKSYRARRAACVQLGAAGRQ
jgi:ABC-type oligopeptide transport system substrate-binding subunit